MKTQTRRATNTGTLFTSGIAEAVAPMGKGSCVLGLELTRPTAKWVHYVGWWYRGVAWIWNHESWTGAATKQPMLVNVLFSASGTVWERLEGWHCWIGCGLLEGVTLGIGFDIKKPCRPTFTSLCLFSLPLSLSLFPSLLPFLPPFIFCIRCKLPTTAAVPSLPACCQASHHNSHRVTLWNRKQDLN